MEGRESGEKIEAYCDELMMPLMSILLVPSLSSLLVKGMEYGRKDEVYHDKLMIPLMSMLLDHLSDGWCLARLVAFDYADVDGVGVLKSGGVAYSRVQEAYKD